MVWHGLILIPCQSDFMIKIKAAFNERFEQIMKTQFRAQHQDRTLRLYGIPIASLGDYKVNNSHHLDNEPDQKYRLKDAEIADNDPDIEEHKHVEKDPHDFCFENRHEHL